MTQATTTRLSSDQPPDLVGRAPEDYAQELQEFLRRLLLRVTGGIPAGFNEVEPSEVKADQASSPGEEGQGWAAANHIHAILTAAAVDLGETNEEGNSEALARANHVHRILQRVLHEGVLVGVKHSLNFLDSPSLTWTITLDVPNDRINIMGVATGGGATPWNNNWWGPPIPMYFG